MFEGKSLLQIIASGGFIMYILILCSVISIAVAIDRILYYQRRSKIDRDSFMKNVRNDLEGGRVSQVIEACKKTDTPFASVIRAGLTFHGHSEKIISEAMERETMIETIKLEKFTSICGTIGSTAVYIGLLGTVLGIMHAFHNIASQGAGGLGVVIQGISEALIATAAGLIVAIPAVMFYNYFIRRIDHFVADMELCASELIDLLSDQK